ncbi:hypothetical protein T4E_6868 [Trichinella pseudospiralis]|uniref:Uncharacterized protein n=1 Tax=Trichinella pseudospiralis TaxID=6337 RepID=A0A0V0Y9V7_TRIPS|nr:hypothetical protein T4E_6868 [Trichinella pseudospiralis]
MPLRIIVFPSKLYEEYDIRHFNPENAISSMERRFVCPAIQRHLALLPYRDMDCPAFITGSAFNRDKILSGVGIGLHIWREIDGEPYLVPFEVEDNKNKEMAAKSSLLSNLWKKRMLTPEAQAANIFRPVSVAWINSQDILILFSDGCLVVQEHSCNFKDPIWKKILYRFDYDCYKVASRSESVCFLEVARSDNANDSSFVMTSLKSTFNFSLYYLKWLIYSFIGEAYNEKKYPSSLVIETILWKIRTISPSYLLMEGDVLGAAAVADRAKQPLESFYKQFWQESHFDMDAIEQFLAPVGDKLWCLRQCAEQVPDSAEDYCHLLIHGMNVGARLLESGEFEEVIIVDLLHKIVRYWHILQTLLESRNASVHEFVSDSFLEFQQTMLLLRDKDPIWLAVHFAKAAYH